jgi:PKD repeat protein
MADQVSSFTTGYKTGDLSLFPIVKDDKDILYEAKNNGETKVSQSVVYTAKNIVVESTSSFPNTGIIRIGNTKVGEAGNHELIYYGKKTTNTFKDTIRGFAGSIRGQWPLGSNITSAVMASHHNSIKDAIINIETDLGIKTTPNDDISPVGVGGSLNQILKKQEERFLGPKPSFRAYPVVGAPPLKVKFANFSGGPPIRYLWEFGDGSSSTEMSPVHTYTAEGNYTVKLNMMTLLGEQAATTKNNYIVVDKEETEAFFYSCKIVANACVRSIVGVSEETATLNSTTATEFTFVDQTDGNITERHWVFDDTTQDSVYDPNKHTIKHTYASPGTYDVNVIIIFSSGKLKRVFLEDSIIIS